MNEMTFQSRFKQALRNIRILLLLLSIFLVSGCEVPEPLDPASNVKVAGAMDMLSVVNAIRDDFFQTTHLNIDFVYSNDPLADLKSGRVDAVLLGRAPVSSELIGVRDFVVAYDAVCVLINERTYLGGVQDKFLYGLENTHGQPIARYEGFKDLSLEELRGLVATTLRFSNVNWVFSGTKAAYYTYEPYMDLNNQTVPDPDNPGWFLGQWTYNDISPSLIVFQPGLFDTQSLLLQKLMIPESVLSNPDIGFFSNMYNSEELLISQQFDLDKQQSEQESFLPFTFTLELASRKITLSALDHGFAIHPISIDGMDPLDNPSDIYDGSYPLSRKIHLMLSGQFSRGGYLLSNFLQSPQGQALLEKAHYLPLPTN